MVKLKWKVDKQSEHVPTYFGTSQKTSFFHSPKKFLAEKLSRINVVLNFAVQLQRHFERHETLHKVLRRRVFHSPSTRKLFSNKGSCCDAMNLNSAALSPKQWQLQRAFHLIRNQGPGMESVLASILWKIQELVFTSLWTQVFLEDTCVNKFCKIQSYHACFNL